MGVNEISDLLIKRGQELFDSPRVLIDFTGDDEANNLLNDLDNYPHAYVLACIMDRQMPAEKVWRIPLLLKEKLNDFSMTTLSSLTLNDIINLMTSPSPLHRFPDVMSNNLYFAIKRLSTVYSSFASNIWSNNPSSALVFYRFLEFEGVGHKIASMATNILAREYKISFSDYYSIDISADSHVKRVFHRLGLIPENSTVEHVIYRARSLYPEFPGLMDYPCWELGRKYCRSRNPNCTACYMNQLCPKIII